MNSFIETLNQWGVNFLGFAWPMLWQSSLLIAALLVFDFIFRRKLRASIRYALWLVVLVKLCVPPTLALPTSPAWWLHQTPPPAVVKPKIQNYTVTYDEGPLPELPQVPLPAFEPPKPALTKAAWLLAGSVAVSGLLFGWMLVRWWQVARLVRRATAAEQFSEALDDALRLAGAPIFRSACFIKANELAGLKTGVPTARPASVCLKMVEGRMSPAVCGLFRPVILLPRALAEKLSDEQLRAVLLHELIHLRRGDVWLNFLQTLLQIAYWWHPLVWLANARIRRVREEAVDDAVMLALRDEAETYAPTLLEVAKLALNRPLATLGLVGILESRSALRQRIERLVDFHPPRQAGLTLVSLLGILAFTAVAVPMGEGPAPVAKSNATDATVTGEQSLTIRVNPEIFFRNLKAQAAKTMQSPTNFWGEILMELLRDEGVDCNPPHGLAFTNTTGDLTTQNTPEQLEIFRRVVEQLNRADGICELPMGDNPLRKNVLIEGRIYPMSDDEFGKFTSGLHRYSGGSPGEGWWSVPPETFKQFVSSLEASGLRLIQRPRIQTAHGITATLYVGDRTNSLELGCKPLVGKGFIDLVLESTVISKAPANAVTNHVFSKASAKDRGGIVLRMANYGGYAGSNLVMVISAEIVTNTTRFQERLVAVIKREPADTARQTENLVQNGKLLYEMDKGEESKAKLQPALAGDSNNVTAKHYVFPVKTNSVGTNTYTGLGRQEITKRLHEIRLDRVGFHASTLGDVVRFLAQQTKTNDPEKKGINFLINPNPDGSGQTDLQIAATRMMASLVTIDPPLTNAPLGDVLDAVVRGASEPIHYSVQDFAIVISVGKPAQPLYARTFRVDTNAFYSGLKQMKGAGVSAATNSVLAQARNFFSNLGVDLNSPPGKAVYFNDRRGTLYVKATTSDLDTIEHSLEVLNSVPPQIHIKAQFVEVPKEFLGKTGMFSSLTNSPNGGFTGILTSTNAQFMLKTLQARKDVEFIAEPEVITLGGRQTQMRATQIQTMVTNLVFQETATNQSIVPQVGPIETGAILDVVPHVAADGYIINLTLIPTLIEFLGYDNTTNTTPAYNKKGERIDVPKVQPKFHMQHLTATVNLWDGQTVILGGMSQKNDVKDKVPVLGSVPLVGRMFRSQHTTEREILVFITATIVDPAGNRVHPDDSNDGIPPQPSQK